MVADQGNKTASKHPLFLIFLFSGTRNTQKHLTFPITDRNNQATAHSQLIEVLLRDFRGTCSDKNSIKEGLIDCQTR